MKPGRLFSLIALLAVAATGAAFADPLTMAPAVAPSGKREIVVTHFQNKLTGETRPLITLVKPGWHRTISSAQLEIDESDARKSVEALWSPNSRYVAINAHLGQLYWFTIYDVSNDALDALPVLPMGKKFTEEYFTPATTKSRGGEQVLRWTDPTTFLVEDTMYEVTITYHITKQALEATSVKPKVATP